MKRIYHNTWKEGTVISETENSYTVLFDSVGEKVVNKLECLDILHD